jgi:hypothetical protein
MLAILGPLGKTLKAFQNTGHDSGTNSSDGDIRHSLYLSFIPGDTLGHHRTIIYHYQGFACQLDSSSGLTLAPSCTHGQLVALLPEIGWLVAQGTVLP